MKIEPHDFLRLLRDKHQKSQKEVADYLGMAANTYWRIETGGTALLYKILVALAEYYGMSPAEMVVRMETGNVDGPVTGEAMQLPPAGFQNMEYCAGELEKCREELMALQREHIAALKELNRLHKQGER